MKRLLLSAATAAAVVLAPGSVQALGISLDADSLRDAVGGLFPVSGLVVLTAATSGTFLGPTSDSFASGSDLEVARWDLSSTGTPGAISVFEGLLDFSGNWDAGDPLRLYWYPELGLSSTEPGFGTSYGTYSDLVGIDGSDAWITPSESGVISLRYLTTDAGLFLPGSNSPASAEANFEVVPEPGTVVFGLAVMGALGCVRRRRR